MNNKIKIGNQTASSSASIMAPFEYAVEAGFEAFEWFPDKKDWGAGFNASDIDRDLRRFIRDRSLENALSLSVHVDCAFNPLYQHTHNLFYESCDLAIDIGAKIINTHLFIEQGVPRYFDRLLPIIAKTHEAGLKLSIENTPETTPQDFNALFRLLKDNTINGLDSSAITTHVGMCLDVGHANLCYTTNNDFLGFINQLDSDLPIIHIHLHENYGDNDSHLAIFTGPAGLNPHGIIEVLKHLKEIEFAGAIILEQWPQDPSVLKTSRDRLVKILSEI